MLGTTITILYDRTIYSLVVNTENIYLGILYYIIYEL